MGSRSLRQGLVLAGCLAAAACTNEATNFVDPLSIGGRNGSTPVGYATLMRIGTAARAGGDYANAVSIFRRAATLEPGQAAPLVAAGETLRDMGEVNEAIVAYTAALKREPRNLSGLEGLAKAYLGSGRPELASQPLAVAYHDAPHDPRVLMLLGVTADYTGKHREAQAFYHEGLAVAPNDRALTLDLALSLALTENYDAAIAQLRPIATARDGSPRERQTLALIYGLKGDRGAAETMARIDLAPAAVEHNLAYYDTLRRLPPEARSKAILSAATHAASSPRPS
jgi:Flp pilus assembly protein TadD